MTVLQKTITLFDRYKIENKMIVGYPHIHIRIGETSEVIPEDVKYIRIIPMNDSRIYEVCFASWYLRSFCNLSTVL